MAVISGQTEIYRESYDGRKVLGSGLKTGVGTVVVERPWRGGPVVVWGEGGGVGIAWKRGREWQ